MAVVANGASRYRIVVPDEPDPVTGFAAGELQRFLADISGATLPIVREGEAGAEAAFLLGPTARARATGSMERLARLGEDGVSLQTAGRDVVLLGQNQRGQLYSVYVLLERFLGVRFLARDCTVIPRQDTVALPAIDCLHAPPFSYRETLYYDSFPADIAARQRLNGPASACNATVGGKVVIHPYVHSFAQLVPPEKHFAQHPEYFSLVGGKRTDATVHGQLCLTNPEVLEIATARVERWIEEHPDISIFDVSQNDGEGACECADCAAVVQEEGSQSGPILRFVNAIADVVAARYPGKWVETLAYAYSVKPPARTRPRDNVIIRLCHEGCYFHGIERCRRGADFLSHIEEWRQLARRLFVWHYATNFHHYVAPNPNLEGLARDIKCYAARGVEGLMIQGNYQCPGGELAELRQYLAAQLMWDPEREPEAIREEFCRGYYGSAADAVLEYLAVLDRAAEDPNVHAFCAWDPQETVTPELVAAGLEILAPARARANTAEEAGRILRVLLPLWYMQLTYPDRYALAPADAPRLLREFRSVAAANQTTYIGEGFSGENMPRWLAKVESHGGDMSNASTAET